LSAIGMTENAPPPPAAPPPVPAAQVQQFNQVLEVDEVYPPPLPPWIPSRLYCVGVDGEITIDSAMWESDSEASDVVDSETLPVDVMLNYFRYTHGRRCAQFTPPSADNSWNRDGQYLLPTEYVPKPKGRQTTGGSAGWSLMVVNSRWFDWRISIGCVILFLTTICISRIFKLRRTQGFSM